MGDGTEWRTWRSATSRVAMLWAAGLVLAPGALAAQSAASGAGDALTTSGVNRASALIDAVYIDRSHPDGMISGGDLGSYLMARLGIYPIPADLRFRVKVDTLKIVLFGRIADLPLETRAALSQLLGMFPSQTMVEADVTLSRYGPEVLRFHLAVARVNGVPLPEGLLARVMTQVGQQYPELSRTGRDLFVRVPSDGEMTLLQDSVRVWRRER